MPQDLAWENREVIAGGSQFQSHCYFLHRLPSNQMGVSKNNGIPKSSILIGFSIRNHPFCCTPVLGNTQMASKKWLANLPDGGLRCVRYNWEPKDLCFFLVLKASEFP